MKSSVQSFNVSGSLIAKWLIYALVAMFFGANLSQILIGRENMIYLFILPLSLFIGLLFFFVRFQKRFAIHLPNVWAVVLVSSIGLYLASSIYGFYYVSNVHFLEWTIARTAFLVNILFIFLVYLVSSYYPKIAYRALILVCKAGIIVTAFTFVLYIISFTSGILPDRFIIYYSNTSMPFFGGTFHRFGGLFKEPAEAAFFLIFSSLVLRSHNLNKYAFSGIFMGIFLVSNAFWFLLVCSFLLYIGIRYFRKIVVPLLLLTFFAIILALALIEPQSSYFVWLDYLLPRASSLYRIDDDPQRLWSNWVAIKDFIQFNWPLGGGAGFIRTYGKEYYLFSEEVSHGAGGGLFKFLSDFGLIGIPLVFGGAIKLHKYLVSYNGKTILAVAAMLCVIYMSVRSGYYNISVWTCFFVLVGRNRIPVKIFEKRKS